MSMYAGVQVSGVDTQLNGAYMTVSFPTINVSDNSVTASNGASLVKDPAVEKENDNYNIKYYFSNLSGGMKVQLPIRFRAKSFSSSKGYIEIPVKATLYDSAGNIQGEEELIFKSERVFNITFSDYSSWTNNSYYDKYRNSDYTSTDPDELSFQNYSFGYYISGNTLPDSVQITATLAEGVIYDEEKNKDNGWVYDAATRTLTLKNVEYKESLCRHEFYFKFSNWKYDSNLPSVTFKGVSTFGGNEVATATVQYYQMVRKNNADRDLYMSDAGLALEKEGDLKNLTYKRKDNYIPLISKNKDKNIYTKMNIYDSASLRYIPVDGLVNDTSTSDFYINQLVFGKDSIDLNFSKFYVDSSKITNNAIRKNFKKNNVLYGVKDDNTKVEIARNIEMDQEIDIPSQTKDNKYKTLQLEFPDGFNLVRKYKNKAWDDTINFDVYVGTKFFEDDWNAATYSYDKTKRFLSQRVYYSRTKGGDNKEKNNNFDSYYSSDDYRYPYSSVGLVPEEKQTVYSSAS